MSARVKHRKRHPVRNFFLITVCIFAAFASGYFIKFAGFSIFGESVRATSVTVEKQLKAIGELATYEYFYKDVAQQSSTRTFVGFKVPGTTNKVMVIYHGVIKVGYKVSGIEIQVTDNPRQIRVKLPDPVVLDNYIDKDADLIEENNIFNPIRAEEIFQNLDEQKKAALEDAIEMGIYEKARENAESIIAASLAVFSNYEVIFE